MSNEKSNPAGGADDKESSALGNAIGAVERLANAFMQKAPLFARLIMAFFAISIILMLFAIGAVVLINPMYGIGILLISLVPMGITFYIIRKVLPVLEASSIMPNVIRKREYIDTLKYDSFGQINPYLEAVRKKAHETIQTETNQTIPLDSIRANVFLPDCTPTGGYVFKLCMPDGLRCNMKSPNEWGIKFKPGQGSTGTCFNEGQSIVTLDKDFINVEELKRNIEPDLKWIISIPMMKEGAKEKYPIGVLNIDCLGNGIEKQSLDAIISKLDPTVKDKIEQLNEVSTVQQRLNAIPKSWELIIEAKSV